MDASGPMQLHEVPSYFYDGATYAFFYGRDEVAEGVLKEMKHLKESGEARSLWWMARDEHVTAQTREPE